MAQSLETLRNNRITSIHGRRLGLDKDETLVGPKAIKKSVLDLTSGSSAQAIPAYGYVAVRMSGSMTTASQPAFTISNPIPGVDVAVNYAQTSQAATAGSTAVAFIRASTAFYIQSTDGSTGVAVLVAQGGAFTLRGLSTDLYQFIRHGTSASVVVGAT